MIRRVLFFLFVVLLLPVPRYFSGSYQVVLQVVGGGLAVLFFMWMALFPDGIHFCFWRSLDFVVLVLFVVLPVFFFLFGLFSGNDVEDALVDLFKFGVVAVVYLLFRDFFAVSDNRESLAKWLSHVGIPIAFLIIVWLLFSLPQVSEIGYYRMVLVPETIASLVFAVVLVLGAEQIRLKVKFLLLVLMLVVCALAMGRMLMLVALSIAGIWFLGKYLIKSVWLRRVLAVVILLVIVVYPCWLIQKRSLRTEDLSVWWRQNEWSYVMRLAENDDLVHHLIGHGFGFLIVADTPLESADGMVYDKLPNFHSLWLFLFAKTGILGVGLFFCFLAMLWKQHEMMVGKGVLSLLLLFSILLDFSLAGSVTGLFTQSYLYPFLLGLKLAAFEGTTGRGEKTCVS